MLRQPVLKAMLLACILLVELTFSQAQSSSSTSASSVSAAASSKTSVSQASSTSISASSKTEVKKGFLQDCKSSDVNKLLEMDDTPKSTTDPNTGCQCTCPAGKQPPLGPLSPPPPGQSPAVPPPPGSPPPPPPAPSAQGGPSMFGKKTRSLDLKNCEVAKALVKKAEMIKDMKETKIEASKVEMKESSSSTSVSSKSASVASASASIAATSASKSASIVASETKSASVSVNASIASASSSSVSATASKATAASATASSAAATKVAESTVAASKSTSISEAKSALSASTSASSASISASTSESTSVQKSTSVSSTSTLVASQVTKSDILVVQQSFTSAIQETKSVEAVYHGLAGLALVGAEPSKPEAKKVCDFLRGAIGANSSKITTMKSLFDIVGAAQVLPDCDLQILQPTVSALAATAKSSEEMFQLTSVQTTLGIKVDTKKTISSVITATKSDHSILSLGYAMQTVSQFTIEESSAEEVIDMVKDTLVQAQDSGDSFLQFEGGVGTTATIVSGICSIAEKVDIQKLSFIKQEHIVKLTNYLLANKNACKDSKDSFKLMQALKQLANNKIAVPAIISIEGSTTITRAQKKIQVRVTNCLGQPLPTSQGLKVTLNQAADVRAQSIDVSQKELTLVESDTSKTLYEMDASEYIQHHGQKKLSFSVQSTDARIVSVQNAEVSIQVKKEITCDSFAVATVDRSTNLIQKAFKWKLGTLQETLYQFDGSTKLAMRFMLKDNAANKFTQVTSAFINVEHSISKKEHVFPVFVDKTNTFRIELDLQQAAKTFDNQGGPVTLKLVVGDDDIANQFVWRMANANITFSKSEEKVSIKQSSSSTSISKSSSSSVNITMTEVLKSFSSMSSSYVSETEVHSFKSLASTSLTTVSDLKSLYYGTGVLSMLSQDVSGFKEACDFAKAQKPNDLETLFRVTTAASRMSDCTLEVPPTAEQLISKVYESESCTSQSIHFAARTQSNLNLKMDNAKIISSLLEATKRDSSAKSIAYALHTAALLNTDKAQLTPMIQLAKQTIQNSMASEETTINFESSVSATANLIHGVYALSETSNVEPPLTTDEFAKVTNYLLNMRKYAKQENIAYQLTKALRTLNSNKFHVAACASIADDSPITSDSPNVEIRVKNIFSEPVPSFFTLKLASATHVASGTVITADDQLETIASDKSKTTFQFNFLKEKRLPGEYKLIINIESPDKRLVLVQKEVSIKVQPQVAINAAEIKLDASSALSIKSGNVLKLDYPNSYKEVVQCDASKQVNLNFQIEQKDEMMLSTKQKAYLVVQHSETKEEHMVSVDLDSLNNGKLQFDMQSAAEQFKYKSGPCSLKLVVGDAKVAPPFVWKMMDMNVTFAKQEQTSISSVSKSTSKTEVKQEQSSTSTSISSQQTKTSTTQQQVTTTYSFMTQSDVEVVKNSFSLALQDQQDLSTIRYAAAGLKTLDQEVSSTQKQEVISTIKKNVEVTKIDSVYQATQAASAIGEKVSLSGAEKTITSVISSSASSSQEIYRAFTSAQELSVVVDEKKVLTNLLEASKRDESATSLAYAFHAASQLSSVTSNCSLVDQMDDLISKAVEVDGGAMLQFDGSVKSTSFVLNGIFNFAQKINTPPPISPEQMAKFTKYLMSNKDIVQPSVGFHVMETLKLLSDNKFFVPVCVTMEPQAPPPPPPPPIGPAAGAPPPAPGMPPVPGMTQLPVPSVPGLDGSDAPPPTSQAGSPPQPGLPGPIPGQVPDAASSISSTVMSSSSSKTVISSRKSTVRFRVTNVLGTAINSGSSKGLVISTDGVAHCGTGAIDSARTSLNVVQSDESSTLYELDFKEFLRQSGDYKMRLSVQSEDKRFLLVDKEFQISAVSEATIDGAELTIAPSSFVTGMPPPPPMKLEYPKLCDKVIEASTGQHQVNLRFQLKQSSKTLVTTQQAFIAVQHSVTKKERIYRVQLGQDNYYSHSLDMQQLAKDFKFQSGNYHLRVLGGDQSANPVIWHMANAKFNFAKQQQQSFSSSQTSVSSSSQSSSSKTEFRLLKASTYNHITKEDSQVMRSVVMQQFKSTQTLDMESVYHSTASMTMLGYSSDIDMSVCDVIKSKVELGKIDSLFYATHASTLLNSCKLSVTAADAQNSLNSLINKPQVDARDIYYALSLFKSYNVKFNTSQVSTHILNSIKKSSSGVSHGYAYHAAALLEDTTIRSQVAETFSSVIERITPSLDQSFMQFEEGITATAMIFSGMLSLSEKIPAVPAAFTQDIVSKYSNYLLSYKGVLDVKITYHLMQSLTLLSSSKHFTAVSVSSVSSSSSSSLSSSSSSTSSSSAVVSSSCRQVQVRLLNVLGQPLRNPPSLQLETATQTRSGSVDLAKRKFSCVCTDESKSLTAVDFFDAKQDKGDYKLSLSLATSEKKFVMLKKELSVKVATAVEVSNFEMGLVGGESSNPIRLQYPEFSSATMDLALGLKASLKFQLMEKEINHLANLNQAFLVLSSATEVGKEAIFAISPDSSNTYSFQLDPQLAKDQGLVPGQCNVKLIVGDQNIDEPFVWHMADINLRF